MSRIDELRLIARVSRMYYEWDMRPIGNCQAAWFLTSNHFPIAQTFKKRGDYPVFPSICPMVSIQNLKRRW